MAGYTRQSSFSDGDTITAALFNNEYNQLVNAFNVSSGHTHDGSTTGDGGPISNLFSNALVFGTNAESDIAITFNAASNDGVLTWKEDEDYFEFSDDLLIATTEKIQFRDTAIYINSSTDGQLDLVADTEIQIAATTIDMNGAADISGNLAVGGNLTVTGNATISGNLTFGDAASDTVAFSADVASNLLPSADNTYDLGASGSEWKDLYVDGVAYVDAINFNGTAISATAAELNIMDGVTATTAELNILDGVTSTAAELNILDGVTSTAAELNILDGVTSTTAELNILDGVTSSTAELNILDGVTSTTAELNILDGVTASATDINLIDGITNGTVIASKAIITDANKDITGGRNITISGELDAATLDISGDADIDGTLETDALSINGTSVTSTAAELNILDGVTSTAAELNILDGVTSSTAELNILDGVTSTAAELNILDGVTSTAAELNILDGVTSTAAELNILDGATVVVGELNYLDLGSTAVGTAIASKAVVLDSNKDYTGLRNLTITGELDAATLDVSGDVDIDGTLEADAITVNGTALASVIAGTTVSNATLAATTTVTDSTANTNFPVVFHDESNGLLDDTGALRYNPSTGELLVPKLTVAGTTTTADTVTMQASNAIIFEGATADSNETTLSIVDPTSDHTQYLINQGGYIPVLAAATTTQISATPAELNLLDGSTANTVVNSKAVVYGSSGELAGTLSTAAQTNVTSLGTLTSLNVGTVTSTGNLVLNQDSGTIFIGADLDMRILHDGSNGTFRNDTGNLTIDVGGDIILDAGGDDITFKSGGTEFGSIFKTSNDLYLNSAISDGDIKFRGNDGGSFITALTLDMSAAGAASFNAGATFGSHTRVNGDFSVSATSGEDRFAILPQSAGSGTIFFSGNEGLTGYEPLTMDFEDLRLRTSGTERMRISSSGNVGIGETSPDAPLHITSATPIISFDESDASQEYRIGSFGGAFALYDSTDSAYRLTVDGSGNVGVGTTSPASLLSLQGDAELLRLDGTANTTRTIFFRNTTAANPAQIHSDGSLKLRAEDSGTHMEFHTVDTERMRIDSSGRVGIGTTSPQKALDIAGASVSGGGVMRLSGTGNASQGDVTGAIQFHNADDTDNTAGVFGIIRGIAGASGGEGDIQILTDMPSEGADASTVAMHISSTAKVGIGTASPSSILHLVGGSATIPTLSSSFPFTISNNGNSGMNIISSGTTNAGQINFGDEGDADAGSLRYDHNDNSMRFTTNTSEAMRIDSSGRLLVGSTTAVENTGGTGSLQVLGTGNSDTTFTIGRFSSNTSPGTLAFTKSRNGTIGGNTIVQDDDNLGQIIFTASDGTDMMSLGAKIEAEVDGTPGSNDLPTRLCFFTAADGADGATERLRIDSSGAFQIGGTTNAGFIDFDGSSLQLNTQRHPNTGTFVNTSKSNARIELIGNDADAHIKFRTTASNNTSATERMQINKDGDVLIGTTSVQGVGGITFQEASSGYTIQQNMDGTSGGADLIVFRRNSTQIGSINQSSTNAVTYNTSSDARLKDVTGTSRGLDVINNLNPVAYNWKADNHADEGLIAQEVEKLVPNAVNQDEDGYYSMDYSKLVTHLVKGMQEQQEEIEELKKNSHSPKGLEDMNGYSDLIDTIETLRAEIANLKGE